MAAGQAPAAFGFRHRLRPALAVDAGRRALRNARTADSPWPTTVRRGDHDRVFSTGGERLHAIAATTSRDVLEASPDTRRQAAERFEDLLASIEGGLQILVRSRPADHAEVTDLRLREQLLGLPGPHLQRRVTLVLTELPATIDRLRGAVPRWPWRPRPAIEGAVHPPEGGPHADRPMSGGAPSPGTRLDSIAEGAARQLRAMGLAGRVLTGRELDRHLDATLPALLARPGVRTPWLERPDHLELDGELSRTYFLDGFPGSELELGWLAPLLDLPISYDLAIHAAPLPADDALRLLNRRIRNLEAATLSGAAASDPLVESGLPDARGLRREVATNRQAALTVSVCLTVVADTTPGLAFASGLVEDAASRCLARLLPARYEMAAGKLTTLPLGADALAQAHVLPAAAAATLYPWTWEESSGSGGHLLGIDLRGGAPVVLDTFDATRLPNANLGVFGHSGTGKTHLVRRLLRDDAAAGVAGFVIDPEAEYRDLCAELGGQWVDLALGSGHSINVLDTDLAALGERDPEGDLATDLLDLLGTMCGRLADDERTDVDEALRPLLGARGATLSSLRDALERLDLAPRVARGLRRWTQGPLGEMFARPTNVDLRAPLVVFGLRDVKDELLPVVYFVIAQWLWCRVRADRRPRRLVFDEVGLLVEHELIRRFLVRLARRVRKYQGSLCLVTQNAGDLLSSDQGLVLATNPATLLLGAQRQAEALRMQRAYALTDGQVAFLGAARRGEFLLLSGDSRRRVRVIA